MCEIRKTSPNKLALLSGMPAGSLKSIFLIRAKNLDTRMILDLYQALDVSLFDFFNDELFKDKDLEGNY